MQVDISANYVRIFKDFLCFNKNLKNQPEDSDEKRKRYRVLLNPEKSSVN